MLVYAQIPKAILVTKKKNTGLLRPIMTKELAVKKQKNNIVISQVALKIEFYFLSNMDIQEDKWIFMDTHKWFFIPYSEINTKF